MRKELLHERYILRCELRKLTADFMKEIIEKHKDNERIMIVAHGAINKALMRYVRKNEIKDFWMGSLQRNCGVTIVEFKDGKFNILEENTVFYDYKKNK